MIHRKIALIVALGCLVTVASFAATYYVDPSAGSDSNSGTATTSAWQHIPGSSAASSGSGWKVLAAGDTLYVKGGTVSTDSILIDASHYGNGTASSLIKIMSGHLNGWGTGRAVLDGGATTSGSGTYSKGFHINGPLYIHIEGFEVRNYANATDSGGVFIDGNSVAHDEIVGNLIHEIYGAPGSSGYGIEVTGGTTAGYMLIEKNIIFHTEEKAIEFYRQGNSIVRYNWCYQTNDHAIVISSSNNTIYDNLISQSGYKWMSYESPFRPAFGIKFDSDSSTPADNNLLYNNLIWDCSSGIGILNGNNNKIYFNTVYHSGFQGGEAGGFEGASLSFKDDNGNGNAGAGNDVRNNIFYYNNILNSSGQTVAFASAIGSNNTVSDNVIYRDSSQSNTIYLYTGSSSWNTLSWFQGSSGFSAYGSGNVAANNRAVDPQFTGGTGTALMNACPTGFTAGWAPNVSTFTLSSSTPASVLTGDVMSSPYNVDITGAGRTTFSLGAYEGTGTVVAPPAAPTGFHTVP
jgi:hypothetical protein